MANRIKTRSHSITIPEDTFNKLLKFRRSIETTYFDIDLPISTMLSLLLEWALDKNRVTSEDLLKLYIQRADVYSRLPTRPHVKDWKLHLLEKNHK
jgi:hypothetical protein